MRRGSIDAISAMSNSALSADNGSIRSGSALGGSYQTNGTSVTSLHPLQQKPMDDDDQIQPLDEEDVDQESFDLVSPPPSVIKQYSLETRSEQLFSIEHLRMIFDDPALLLKFTAYLSSHRPASIPLLVYYLDAVKALKAIRFVEPSILWL